MRIKTLLFGLLLGACSQDKPSAVQAKTEPRPFFTFDQVLYYKINIDESDVFSDPRNHSDTLLRQALLDYQPKKLDDTSFLGNLNSLPFKRTSVPPEFHRALSHIFSDKDTFPPAISACIAIYRDILVFKKQSKVTGLAKICFKCKMFYLAGAQASTANFGQYEDYDELEKLLSKQKFTASR